MKQNLAERPFIRDRSAKAMSKDMSKDISSKDQPAPADVPAPLMLPRLSEMAVLLDIDGTLLDLAPTPREVWVPPGLADTLNGLLQRTSGALALAPPGLTLMQGDLRALPDDIGPFDAAISWGNSFGYVTPEDTQRSLAGLRRLVRPGATGRPRCGRRGRRRRRRARRCARSGGRRQRRSPRPSP